jgi:hypothetical protein
MGECKLARIVDANLLDSIECIDGNKKNYRYYFLLLHESRFGVKKIIGTLLNTNGVVHELIVNKIVVIVIQTFI